MPTIRYPTESDLDTRHCLDGLARHMLYLIPAAEARDGLPTVWVHPDVDMDATEVGEGRWAVIGDFHGAAAGAAILARLEDIEPEIVAAAEGYDRQGRWTAPEVEALEKAWAATVAVQFRTRVRPHVLMLISRALLPGLARPYVLDPDSVDFGETARWVFHIYRWDEDLGESLDLVVGVAQEIGGGFRVLVRDHNVCWREEDDPWWQRTAGFADDFMRLVRDYEYAFELDASVAGGR